MSKIQNYTEMTIIDPKDRIKQLTHYGNVIDIDSNVPIKRYYRSGLEMVRQANVYNSEGNLENAYVLYFKFITLFVEKIEKHPEYKTVPAPIKKTNIQKIKEVLPLTEKLKAKLLERYENEYRQFLILKEAERAKEAEAEAQRLKNANRTIIPAATDTRLVVNVVDPSIDIRPMPSAPTNILDQVVYPNDFPSSSNKSNLPTGGLLLPDSKGASKPSIDRTLKPSISQTDSLLEGHLRTVLVPSDTMSRFLVLANKNTSMNIETCGILAGKLAQHKLIITHVILPKQKGTPDSCTTMNEEDIFDIQDQKNLITLGWIHTHPSQTAFLSSVDLHTHCSYQIMMPEALAIVCAPKYQTTGFYCLTPGYGLEYIAQCRQSGFHPHPNDPPLFMDAKHIIIDEKSKIDVIDLRQR